MLPSNRPENDAAPVVPRPAVPAPLPPADPLPRHHETILQELEDWAERLLGDRAAILKRLVAELRAKF